MSSKKMVFSILSLIILCALAFVVTPAPAEVLGKDFDATITLLGTDNVAFESAAAVLSSASSSLSCRLS